MPTLCLFLGTTLAASATDEPSAAAGGPGVAADAKVSRARTGSPDADRIAQAIAVMRSLDGGRLSSRSDAEWVAYYHRNLKADRAYLDQLNAFLQDPENLLSRAENPFNEVDERYRALEAELAESRAEG